MVGEPLRTPTSVVSSVSAGVGTGPRLGSASMVGNREQKGRGFEVRGINHLALVCRDMAATVAFYEGILGMPLTLSLIHI